MKKAIDLTGMRFGKWKVIKLGEVRKRKYFWLCQCDCGSIKIVYGGALKSGRSKSCGCIKKYKDLTGMIFGRLAVISHNRYENGSTFWNCKCICGNKTIVPASSLIKGKTKSCGCYNSDCHATHRLSNTSTYSSWLSMHTRCNNINSKDYEQYGGRGIKICKSWDSFENFFTDMGEKPEHKTLDRIDVNGDYCKENCKWSTSKEQANNKRNNKKITFNGETKNLYQWLEFYGISESGYRKRIKLGWDKIMAATTTPNKKYSHSCKKEVLDRVD